jgi:hypothetical protein
MNTITVYTCYLQISEPSRSSIARDNSCTRIRSCFPLRTRKPRVSRAPQQTPGGACVQPREPAATLIACLYKGAKSLRRRGFSRIHTSTLISRLRLQVASSESPRSKPTPASRRSSLTHLTCSRPSSRQHLLQVQLRSCRLCRLSRFLRDHIGLFRLLLTKLDDLAR